MSSRHTDLNIAQRGAAYALWGLCFVVSILPYWFKYYVLAEVIYFCMYVCFRYRVKVVSDNLRGSFPEKSDEEIAQIRRKFYHHLSEIIINTISLASMSKAKFKKRAYISPENVAKIREWTDGKNMIGMTAHYGCWEYYPVWELYNPTTFLVSVYHPLRNKVFDELMLLLRDRDNTALVPMKKTVRFCLNHPNGVNGKNLYVGLICDQNPVRRLDSHWFRFLNRDTIFFDGGEKLAIKLKSPVLYWRMVRTGRGKYEISCERIYDGTESVAPNQIVGRYVELLQEDIVKCPELWLWSHRRWKHKRQA